MTKKKAKVIFKHNFFEIIEDRRSCFVRSIWKKINLQNLNYWNVELQEAYYSPVEVKERYKLLKK